MKLSMGNCGKRCQQIERQFKAALWSHATSQSRLAMYIHSYTKYNKLHANGMTFQ